MSAFRYERGTAASAGAAAPATSANVSAAAAPMPTMDFFTGRFFLFLIDRESAHEECTEAVGECVESALGEARKSG